MQALGMELDLDIFLQSHDTTISDDEDNHHQTTIDELLLIDSDDSSPSSPQSNDIITPQSNSNPGDYITPDSQLVASRDTIRQSKFHSVNQINSHRFSSLFGSNPKPGAALAAAVAASRSIPTPHAAAIKLRKQNSTTQNLDPKTSTDSEISHEICINLEINHSDAKLVDEEIKLDNLEAESLVINGEVNQVITEHDSETNDSEIEVFATLQSIEDDSISVLSEKTNDPKASIDSEISCTNLDISHSDANIVDEDLTQDNLETENFVISGEVITEHNSETTKLDEKDVESDVSVNVLNPLEFAEELEKKYAFSGLHFEKGVTAQPMKLDGGYKGSADLGYLSTSSDNIITKTIYSQEFKQNHGTPQTLAVNPNYIAVGMSKGVIVLFPSKYSPHYADNMDSKIIMLGLLGDRSYAPVTSMSFNQQGDLLFAGYFDGHYTVWDIQKVSAAKTVTEHKSPIIHMLYLGINSQANRNFNIISGDSKGVIKLIRFSPSSWLNRFSISKTSTLLDESTSTVVCASPLQSVGDSSEGVVIFVTHQSALVAKVISNTPEVYAQIRKPDGAREGSIPYAAWKYISENVDPLLAIAWDCEVQVAKLVKSEVKIIAKWTLNSPAIGVGWLDDQMLVVLTSSGQLCLYTDNGTLIHETSFSTDNFIGYHTYFTNILGNNEKYHHNCIAVRGSSVYLLGPTNLVISRVLPWKERIQVLHKSGDWIGAFNMAMMIYDGQSQSQTHGVFDLPKSLDDVQKTITPFLIELLLAYVDEVFSYLSVALGNQLDNDSEIKEEYTRVGGIAVEICVHIKRPDILFDTILSRFESVQQKETFLELLEPYILKDMLSSLPPEIMQALVEYYSTKGWLQRVEQCVLHMDISSLDFNQVVRLCQEHSLYGALIYLFNKGLDDFKTPLEELLMVFRNNNSPSLGYKILVYLKYCFSGLAFPPGHGDISPARLPSLRMELINLLLEDSNAKSTKSYKNLYHLLELDTEATLEVLKCAFVDEINLHKDLVQNIVDVLACVLKSGKSVSIRASEDQNWPLKDDIGYILEFISHFVACKAVKVSNELLGQIFEYLILEANISPNVESENVDFVKRREKEVLALLEAVPETDWDDRYVLDMCEKAHFYQVCGFIHNSKQQYITALDSFMKDVDEPIHAFSYINYLLTDKKPDSLKAAIISRIPDLLQLNREGTVVVVIQHFYQEFQQILTDLRSNPKSFFLYLKTVIEFNSTGKMSFNSLKKGIPMCFSGTKVDDFLERISEFPKFLNQNPVHVTDEMTELYLELLCKYEPNSVLHYLETSENYKVDTCLRLCQEYNITDAAAFLLERTGDVKSALLFTLSDLEDKFIMLAQSVNDYAELDFFNEIMKKKEVNDILYIVHTCVGLCQRNSSRLDPNESEALWFQLLDKFCEPLTNSNVEMRKLFSVFIKEIIEGMIGYIPLPTVMMKFLSDNSSQQFGDFKVTILEMLGTYDFERRILDTARSIIEDDAYYTMKLLKKEASHGHGPHNLICCICNCLLKNKIQVYNCGHATHLHCGLSTGCPICMPNKKGPARTENGLVNKTLPKHKLSQDTGSVHVHENDHQLSRYEILTNLDKVKVDNMPQMRLAPPAVYHEKVKKAEIEKTKQIKDIKTKGSGVRLFSKSNIFGKENRYLS